MHTYRALFRIAEFTPLFVAASMRCAAETITGLALATQVYGATGSALLSSLAMFGSSFAQLIGAATLLSTADRVRPRAALVALGLGFTIATSALALPRLPVAALLVIQLATGLLSSAAAGIQWGLVDEIVPEGGYILARSTFNVAVGVVHILGFAAGGALLALSSARAALLAAAALYLASVAVARVGLTDRLARAHERASIRQTWSGNAHLWSASARRAVYLAMWLPNGLIVGCEALFVPYAPRAAAWLFVAAATGMLAGDVALGRLVPERRRSRLVDQLRMLLAAPYLLLAASLPIALAVVAVTVASVGYAASLLLQEVLISLTPHHLRGQALGLHSAGMLAMQAAGATIAGLLAQRTSPPTAMAFLALGSLAITIALTRPLQAAQAAAISS